MSFNNILELAITGYTKVQEETNMDKWLELWLDETMKETEINNKEEKL